MRNEQPVTVLRLAHRPGRDERTTTHVGLTARALGADRVVFPDAATAAAETVREVTDRFGGPFTVEVTDAPTARVREFAGAVVHLTMYGLPVQELQSELHAVHTDAPLLVVVGAGKVPFEVYDRADHNVAVTNQPHSEIAGLAVLLDRLFDGRELDREWTDASRRVVPTETGKQVVDLDEE